MEGRVNFYSDNCDDAASFQPPQGRLKARLAEASIAETQRRTLFLA
jgi:hypothetical protein